MQCFNVFADGGGSQLQRLPREVVAEKIKAVLELADEGFGGVLLEFQAVEGLIQDLDRPPVLPAGFAQDQDVVHVAHVVEARLPTQLVVQGLEV